MDLPIKFIYIARYELNVNNLSLNSSCTMLKFPDEEMQKEMHKHILKQKFYENIDPNKLS